MDGYARIIKSKEAIYVRFEKIGNRQKFNQIMDRFNKSFQLKNWDDSKRAWELIPADLEDVMKFCSGIFGQKGYMLSEDNTSPKESQSHFSV